MAEFKLQEDFVDLATVLLDNIISRHLELLLDSKGHIGVYKTTKAVNIIANELLDAYKQGWDDRSITL